MTLRSLRSATKLLDARVEVAVRRKRSAAAIADAGHRRAEGTPHAWHRGMRIRTYLSLLVCALAVSSVAACSDDAESPSNATEATDPATGKTISELALTGPDRTTLPEGDTTQLVATLRYADGTTRDVTSEAQWNTSDSSNATVSPSGLVTAIDEGTVEISVTYNGITQKDTIVITNR